MCILQQYLRNGGSLEQLTEKYAIAVKRDPEYPNLVLFKYNQIDSPMGEKIVQESRGIILDSADDWRIIARPFDKFFNTGEGHAAKIDWTKVIVQEKLDGSLMTLYYYDGKWRVASSGNPSASGNLIKPCKNNLNIICGDTFASYFWFAFASQKLNLPINRNYCYIFELTGPLNRVVIPHKEVSITLLGARNLITQQEILAHEVNNVLDTNFPIVQYHSYKSLEEVIESFGGKSPLSHEGCIALSVDETTGIVNRQKIKHPGYVAIHHAKDGFNEKTFLEIVRTGENSEMVLYYPEYAEMLSEIQIKFDKLLKQVISEYEKYKDIVNQKDFAVAIKNTSLPSALFCLRSGKVKSIKEFLCSMKIEYLMEILQLKNTINT